MIFQKNFQSDYKTRRLKPTLKLIPQTRHYKFNPTTFIA